MAQTIKIKRSSTTAAPSNGTLSGGELAYTSAAGNGSLFIGAPDKADDSHLDINGNRISTLIASKDGLEKGITAYNWGNHASAGYLETTLGTLDGRYGLEADSAHSVYAVENVSNAATWTSFTFPGYNNVIGKDYYVFDVYGYEDHREAGKFVHYTVYVNIKNGAGQPSTSNEITVQVVANLEADQDQTEAGNFEFKLERDLSDNGSPVHKLWIEADEQYSALHIVAAPVYIGEFTKTLSNMFGTQNTEPTTTITYPVTYSLYTDEDVKAYIGDASTGKAYVGDSVSVSGNISGADATLTGSLKGPATFVIDPSSGEDPDVHGDNLGTVEILGNLTVKGTTTTVDSTTINLGDNVIRLNNQIDEETAPPTTMIAGLEVDRGSSSYDSYILWREGNAASKKWVVSEGGPVDYPLLHGNNFDTVITTIDGGTF